MHDHVFNIILLSSGDVGVKERFSFVPYFVNKYFIKKAMLVRKQVLAGV